MDSGSENKFAGDDQTLSWLETENICKLLISSFVESSSQEPSFQNVQISFRVEHFKIILLLRSDIMYTFRSLNGRILSNKCESILRRF